MANSSIKLNHIKFELDVYLLAARPPGSIKDKITL